MPNPNMLEAIYGPELVTILREMEEIFPAMNPHPVDNYQTINNSIHFSFLENTNKVSEIVGLKN